MTALSELIERLEKATGPDRDLDALISRAISGVEPERPRGKGGEHWYRAYDGRLITDDLAPKVTSSIDAALTLVPEGWTGIIRLNEQMAGHTFSTARLWTHDYTVDEYHAGGETRSQVLLGDAVGPFQAETPALALCIASLKALSSRYMEKESVG